MSHIFISYSRKDLDIAQEIVDALAAGNLDTWIDWKSIPKGEDWEKEIYRGIEEADAFLFLISPDSVASEMCNKEIAHALENNKRILPVFIADVDNREIYAVTKKFPLEKQREEINRRNFIICRPGRDDFEKAMGEIQNTIHTDYKWLKYHTKLQVRALEWEQRKDSSRLLRGRELREADERLSKISVDTDPLPTELQRRYLSSSKKHQKNSRLALSATAAILFGLFSWWFLARERPIPSQWLPVDGGPFQMGMDQAEADAAWSMCSEGARNKNSCASAEELLTWSGRQSNAELELYAILDNEVTNAQYQQCVDAGACQPPKDWSYENKSTNNPATNLNWFQANTYCQWLGGRLPTEGEWEKAARGPDGNYFPWGNNWDPTKANLEQYGVGTVQNIASDAGGDISYYKIKNMAGNVQEWTKSDYVYLPKDQRFDNKEAKISDDGQEYPVIVRGGSWVNVRSEGMGSSRGVESVLTRREEVGFRCVCIDMKECTSPWSWWWVWFGN
jgi:formylglycine-generating enzyme required for sulfatase activity